MPGLGYGRWMETRGRAIIDWGEGRLKYIPGVSIHPRGRIYTDGLLHPVRSAWMRNAHPCPRCNGRLMESGEGPSCINCGWVTRLGAEISPARAAGSAAPYGVKDEGAMSGRARRVGRKHLIRHE